MKPLRYVRADVAAMHAIDDWFSSDEENDAVPSSRSARTRGESGSVRGKSKGRAVVKKSGNRPIAKTFDYHVIAGELKGRAITAPNTGATRPPLTRVRRAIFDFLEPHIVGKRYLDLFSGTGSYLFEAVSRGTGFCLGIELERKLTGALESESVRLGVSRRLQFLNADVLKVLPNLTERHGQFDVIMIAPPQYKDLITKTLEVLPDSLLSPDAIVLCQFDPSEKFVADTSRWELLQERKYGNTLFAVLRLRK